MKVVTETEEVKNPQEYGYVGDEKIEITAREFLTLSKAVSDGILATLQVHMPEVTKHINVETSEEVLNPSFADLSSGKVIKVTDRQATFSENNIVNIYDVTKLTRDMTMAQEITAHIHDRNVHNGVAKYRTELEALKEAK